MLEELLKYNNFGSREELYFLLFNALPKSNNQSLSDFKRYCSSNSFSISKSLDGIIKFVEYVGYISTNKEKITLSDTYLTELNNVKNDHNAIDAKVIQSLVDSLQKEEVIFKIFQPDNIKLKINSNQFYIKNNLIPYKYIPIRNLFLAIGFFEYENDFTNNHLLINKKFNMLFKNSIINKLQEKARSNEKRKLSMDELKLNLNKQEEFGKESELKALEFERHRLKGHLFIDKIIRLAEDEVNAGYDILSFDNNESIINDRFIEVKSFNKELSFYWSKNEIEVSKELGEKYFLYLVDRDKMNDTGYSPIIFQNPHKRIFENELWIKNPENWKVFLNEKSLEVQ